MLDDQAIEHMFNGCSNILLMGLSVCQYDSKLGYLDVECQLLNPNFS